jgi:hypothetical protein
MSNLRLLFRIFVLSLAGMILVYLGVGQVLASEWQVTTTRTLTASVAQVAGWIGDFATWAKWHAADVDLGAPTKVAVLGPAGQVGHRLQWTGPKGIAGLTLTAVGDGRYVYEYGFESSGAQPKVTTRGRSRIELQADGAGCRVVWFDGGQWDNLMLRWVGWFGAVQDHCRKIQGASLEALQQELTMAAATEGATGPGGSGPPAETPK